MSSVFKSGTWLLRRIITDMTGLTPVEPDVIVGEPPYSDAAPIYFREGTFFSWHSAINDQVKARVRKEGAQTVLLVRNVNDLVVSMYHHFADDIDREVGRSAGFADLMSRVTLDQGVSMMIAGFATRAGSWSGFGPHAAQIRDMLAFARDDAVYLTSYERLCLRKESEVRRLAEYLGIPLSEERLGAVVKRSSFGAMKKRAEKTGGGSHFRKGEPGSHRGVLGDHHVHMIEAAIQRHAPDLRRLCAELRFPEIVQRLG